MLVRRSGFPRPAAFSLRLAVASLALLSGADLATGTVAATPQAPPYLLTWGSTGSGGGQFDSPRSPAVDSAGDVYVADRDNHRIQKFDREGRLIARWGAGGGDGTPGNGPGEFSSPYAVAVDASDRVVVADAGNSRVQVLDVAGNPLSSHGSFGTGADEFDFVTGVAVDGSGNIYAVDANAQRVQKLDADGNFLRIWGWGVDDGSDLFQICTSTCQAGSAGAGNGQFNSPRNLVVDASGSVYVADTDNHRIQKFDADGNFVTAWGSFGFGEGQFHTPSDVAIGPDGDVYAVEAFAHRLQRFDPSGTFREMWGWGVDDGVAEFQVCTGGCNSGLGGDGIAQFSHPRGIVVDAVGNVYVVDSGNDRIQRFGPAFRLFGS